ncbi:protein FAR1-RELATED SEQUENCE 5-like [Euphorbia lathyris]|uniref:protein FAR1-RELATED SEQUENCE 5-like n=1 Tax=Euphorbia lathyris TaxID=212925 RepID=UPI0033130FE0
MDPRTSEHENSEDEEAARVWVGDGIDYSPYFITSTVFQTNVEAIQWAKNIAIKNGFEIVISSHKHGGKQTLLRCSRGERYRGLPIPLEDGLSRKTKTKACGCPFRLKVRQLQDFSGWQIVANAGEQSTHNHEMIVYAEGHRQISGLSPAAKLIVRDMSSYQAKPCAIMTALRTKHPEDNPTIKHVYNYRDRLRKDGFEGRDMISQFFHLAVTNKYYHASLADSETNVLTHVFMAHPASVELLRTYHWYIGMDSTYKTNKYRMPFFEIVGMTPCNNNFKIAYAIMQDETESSYRWVMECLRNLIGFDMNPTVILTDRELGLMRPVREIFSDSAHMLCTWHINKDVENRVYKLMGGDMNFASKFKNGRWKKIINSQTVDEYEVVPNAGRIRSLLLSINKVVPNIKNIHPIASNSDIRPTEHKETTELQNTPPPFQWVASSSFLFTPNTSITTD